MNKSINIANNPTEILDEQIFSEFMKEITVWDYSNISRENHRPLSHDDKKKIIRQYCFQMKAKNGGKFESIYCLFCLRDKLG